MELVGDFLVGQFLDVTEHDRRAQRRRQLVADQRHAAARQYFRQALELTLEQHLTPMALDVCVGVAQLLALAEHDKAGTYQTKEKARQQLLNLMDQLPLEATDAAQVKGRKLNWQQTARRLLIEL